MKGLKVFLIVLIMASFSGLSHADEQPGASLTVLNVGLLAVDVGVSYNSGREEFHLPITGMYRVDLDSSTTVSHVNVVRRVNLGLVTLTTEAKLDVPISAKILTITDLTIGYDKTHIAGFKSQ